MHKSWPTLVHVHIATEDLETLHPGATGLCFIIKVWLVTLIGLTNSLSTSNFSEMIKNVHVFLVKGVNSLMSSHLGSPMKNIGWFDSNSLSRMYVQQIKNGALMHTVHSLSLFHPAPYATLTNLRTKKWRSRP